uniref:Uncharacterized protein n=1 Tax=Oryza meridionalis TaxID=40149 RepID=A0A0E0CFJ1_9ORYZ
MPALLQTWEEEEGKEKKGKEGSGGNRGEDGNEGFDYRCPWRLFPLFWFSIRIKCWKRVSLGSTDLFLSQAESVFIQVVPLRNATRVHLAIGEGK